MVSLIDKEFIKYFIRLNESQKKSLLEIMKSFLEKNEPVVGNVLFNEYNRELDDAMERINNGKFTSLQALLDESQK